MRKGGQKEKRGESGEGTGEDHEKKSQEGMEEGKKENIKEARGQGAQWASTERKKRGRH